MIALWMVYALVVAGIVGVAAALLDRVLTGRIRHRRWIWLGALVASTAVPLWTAFAPDAPRTPTGPAGQPGTSARQSSAGVAGELGGRLAELIGQADTRTLTRYDGSLATAWFAIALLAVGAFGTGCWMLSARRRLWQVARIDGEEVLLSHAVGPAVVGALRPHIVVPEWALSLPAEQRVLMLAHERQHIRSHDPLLLHAAALITLLMPWNVVAWWILRRLRIAVELDCDARVLAAGGDARAYGNLLLDVCSRRARGGPLLAPALFERTSSLTRRILAMHPNRVRYHRARLALGAAAAGAAVLVACEMPSPEMLAPDGQDAASARVYGSGTPTRNLGSDDLRQLVAQHFPDVARGEGGPKILFVVRTPDAKVVLSESQVADQFVRLPEGAPSADARTERGGAAVVLSPGSTRVRASAGEGEIRMVKAPEESTAPAEVRPKARGSGAAPRLPSGIGALRPDDIETIEVSKHAAGKVAPQPVSVIIITLKPGAVVPR